MARQNKTRYAVLGMLGYQPMSGYDIKKMSDQSISHFWNENYGAIYPTLRKLEEEGLISRMDSAGDGGRERKVYALTDAGRREFETWIGRPPERPILRFELLLKLFFGHEAEPRRMSEMVREELSWCEQTLETLREIETRIATSELECDGSPGSAAAWWLITVRFGKRYYEGIAGWCKETLAEIADMTSREDTR